MLNCVVFVADARRPSHVFLLVISYICITSKYFHMENAVQSPAIDTLDNIVVDLARVEHAETFLLYNQQSPDLVICWEHAEDCPQRVLNGIRL